MTLRASTDVAALRITVMAKPMPVANTNSVWDDPDIQSPLAAWLTERGLLLALGRARARELTFFEKNKTDITKSL